jgi:hypothetical protein
LSQARERGVYFFPGLPNGTEIGQECDQLFSFLKLKLYTNRDRLWKERCKLEGEAIARLGLDDFGYIIFGGKVPLNAETSVELCPAFEDGLRPDLIKKAREKCGYCPATRQALKSDRIRHEIVETADGDVDCGADPYGKLLSILEEDNHKACNQLIEAGYNTAAVNNFYRRVRRVTAAQVIGREATQTLPATRERQDLLQTVQTAGQFFNFTMGGAAMNCSDMLYAFERKNMDAKAKRLIKIRVAREKFAPIKESFQMLMTSGTEADKWKVPEYKVFLR